MTGLTMLLGSRMWALGLWITKAVECCKWVLMGLPTQNLEASGAESSVVYDGLEQKSSENNNINEWPRNCSWDIFIMYMAAFCHC